MANNECTQNPQDTQNVKEMGTQPAKQGIKIISIIGAIEGHTLEPAGVKTTKYEHIIPLLADIEQNEDITGFVVIMNTMGGDVEAGLAIAELIRGMKTPSVSLVLGGGHSIGVPLAVSTDYSLIAPTASMTIHPLRTSGTVITVPETFDYFDKMQDRIIKFVCRDNKISEERFYELMHNKSQLANDTGTVLIGEQAVKEGIIDEVGGLDTALRILKGEKHDGSETETISAQSD